MKISSLLVALAALVSMCLVPTARGATVEEVIGAIVGDYADGPTALHARRVGLRHTEDAVYLELITAFEEINVRQMILTFQQRGDGVTARVNVFPESIGDVMAPDLMTLTLGLWAAPDLFPSLLPSQLDPVCDVEVVMEDGAVTLRATGAPVVMREALLLDLALRFGAERASWELDGFGGDGEALWRVEATGLERTEIEPPVTRSDDGLVVIDIRTGGGSVLDPGDNVAFAYIGVLADGRRFDSTQFPGRGMVTTVFPGPIYEPLARGLEGIACPESPTAETQNQKPIRKVIIPPSLAFGEEGRGPVPPNTTLYYLALVQSIRDN